MIHQTSPFSEVGAADVPSRVDRYLASRSPPVETAASWRFDLLIKFLTPYYNSQFCVSLNLAGCRVICVQHITRQTCDIQGAQHLDQQWINSG